MLKIKSFLACLIIGSPLVLSSCDGAQEATQAAAATPPSVKTMFVKAEDLPLHQEYPGRLAPVRLAEVRARVSGIVLARTFAEGGEVKAGDVLFEIDPANFKAAVDSTKAQLFRTEASLLLTSQQFERIKKLAGNNVTSKAQLDVAYANQKQAEAEVAVARANLRTSELQLSYASVRSPIAGRIGPALVTEGALARQEDGTHMATVRDLTSVFVDFTAPLADLSRMQPDMASLVSDRAEADVSVDLIKNDGTFYERRGRLLFSSALVDETTGQVLLRAEFLNPKDELLPGTYVRVRMAQGVAKRALRVPLRAVQLNSVGQASVILVKDGKAVQQPVTTSSSLDNQWVIQDGLKQGDQIIVDGLDRAVPGAPVKVESVIGGGSDQAAAQQSCRGGCAGPRRS